MNFFEKIGAALRFVGPTNTARAVAYALRRDRLDARRRPMAGAQSTHIGELKAKRKTDAGAFFLFEKAEVAIRFLAMDLVRITWTPGTPPRPYALAQGDNVEKDDGKGPRIKHEEVHDGITMKTDALTLNFSDSGTLTLKNKRGQMLRQEDPPILQGGKGGGWEHQAHLREGEAIHGLGERAAGLDLRGGIYRMWNTDVGGAYGPGRDPLYLGIPLYIGRHPLGSVLVFYENSHDGSIAFDHDVATANFEGGALREYLFVGDVPHLLSRYTELTGRAPLPPRWAFGFHQCRWGYKNEEDVRAVAEGFKKRDLPLDVIHLDIDYMDGYRVFTVDKKAFPDLPKLAADLKEDGIRLVTILDPGVKADEKYALYAEGKKERLFCRTPRGRPFLGVVWPGLAAFPDFTRPKTRAWWGFQYKKLLDQGISGFWHDMNEPASFAAWGDPSLPKNLSHNLDGIGGDHAEAHNVYGHLMAQSAYEVMKDEHGVERPWIVTRSGWAGTQRYAWKWTGDTESTWEALRMTIPQVINLGLSGIPYVGPDIGGFSGAPDKELFIRWFQLATFLPFMRVHSALDSPRREPWAFDDETVDICRTFLKLRHRLIPTFEKLAEETQAKGWPLVRPMFWHSENADADGLEDQFFLGEDLLVAPVLEKGATERKVHLPKGKWRVFEEDEVLEGGKIEVFPVQLGDCPCFEQVTRGNV
jgi:alpha-glucosidase